MSKKDARIIMTQGEICELLRVSAPTVVKYGRLGMPIIRRGRYDAGAVVQWYVQHQINLEKKKIGDVPTDKKGNPETRLLEARAIKLEMENAEKQRELIKYEEFSAFITWFTTLVANGFESLGARLGTVLAGIDEPAEIQAEIWREGRQIRRLLADKLRKADLEKILPPEDDDEPVKTQ